MIALLFVVIFIIILFRVGSDSSNTGSHSPSNTPSSAPTPKHENPVTPKYTQEEYKARRIAYYKQSKRMPTIIEFLTQHGTPYKIIIKLDSIESYYTGGVDRFVFLAHGISNLHSNDSLDRKIETSDPYYLACAINESLNLYFTVTEINKIMRFEHNDGSVDYPLLFQHVEMTRPVKQF